MSDDELADVDLRPSPWIVHRWVVGLIGVGYAVFALAIWSGPHRTALARALAEAVVIMLGAAVLGFVALASAMVSVFARHRHPLVLGYAATIAIVGAVMALWTLAP